jgi:hypothetical protein
LIGHFLSKHGAGSGEGGENKNGEKIHFWPG